MQRKPLRHVLYFNKGPLVFLRGSCMSMLCAWWLVLLYDVSKVLRAFIVVSRYSGRSERKSRAISPGVLVQVHFSSVRCRRSTHQLARCSDVLRCALVVNYFSFPAGKGDSWTICLCGDERFVYTHTTYGTVRVDAVWCYKVSWHRLTFLVQFYPTNMLTRLVWCISFCGVMRPCALIHLLLYVRQCVLSAGNFDAVWMSDFFLVTVGIFRSFFFYLVLQSLFLAGRCLLAVCSCWRGILGLANKVFFFGVHFGCLFRAFWPMTMGASCLKLADRRLSATACSAVVL